jgi:hypothetical protein
MRAKTDPHRPRDRSGGSRSIDSIVMDYDKVNNKIKNEKMDQLLLRFDKALNSINYAALAEGLGRSTAVSSVFLIFG